MLSNAALSIPNCSQATLLISVMLVFSSFLMSAMRSMLFCLSSMGSVHALSIMNSVIMSFSLSFLDRVTRWFPGNFLPVASS